MKKTLLKMIVMVGGIGIIYGLFYHYMITTSTNSIASTIEDKMELKNQETLIAIEIPVAILSTKEEVDELVKEPEKTQKPEQTQKPKATKKPKENRNNYISIEEYREKMNINMDISHSSGLSKKDFLKLANRISKKYPDKDPTGFYKTNASFIWDLGQEFQVDEVFLLGITAHESGWATYENAIIKNNFTGRMGKGSELFTYASVKESLRKTAKELREDYLGKRKTLLAINKKYCEPVKGEYTWYNQVYGCMKNIVG